MSDNLSYDQLACMIDHAALKPDLTYEDLNAACETAHKFGVKSICVRPCDVPLACDIMEKSQVLVGTVVGFPSGSHHPKIKVAETRQAIEDGAQEIDMVANISWLKSGAFDLVESEVAAVVDAAAGKCVKVILECCFLTEEQIASGCRAVIAAGAQFVKTSTGFGPAGATLEAVTLMKQTVGEQVGIKASGGISTLEQAEAFITAGATRIGTSKSAIILTELERRLDN